MNWNIIICKSTYILVLLALGIIGSFSVAVSNPTCPVSTILCNGTCINTSVDPLNCGSCGNACPAGTACVKGNCSCLVGLELCNGTCTETSFDSRNCGSCEIPVLSGRHASMENVYARQISLSVTGPVSISVAMNLTAAHAREPAHPTKPA